jgi:uracil-DNA glycosylase family 4
LKIWLNFFPKRIGVAKKLDDDGVLKSLRAYAGLLKYSNVKYILASGGHPEPELVLNAGANLAKDNSIKQSIADNFSANAASVKKSPLHSKGSLTTGNGERGAAADVIAGSLELFSLNDEAAQYGSLDALKEVAMKCTQCVLATGRTHVVFGEGAADARLMFIGEGPGEQEDIKGRPFVGRAGQLLDKMIVAMGFKREEVYIANIVKCRPPQNRAPLPDEAVSCLPYLRAQISFIKPKIIVLLGAVAVKFLLQTNAGISQVRGKFLDYYGYTVMPTFHPAFLLRSPAKKKEAWEDLKKVIAFLKES